MAGLKKRSAGEAEKSREKQRKAGIKEETHEEEVQVRDRLRKLCGKG